MIDETIEKNFNTAFAIAWDENQGGYSENIAKKTLMFAKNQGLKINTVLDICCGSANFLREMRDSGKTCTGTEILDSYIEYDKKKYPNIEFIKTENLLDFDKLGSYDLISCNHDMLNTLPTLADWSTFFKKSYAHLNNGGILLFDYYTKRKLSDWNEVSYDENEKLDYIKTIVCDGKTSTAISNIYYINIANVSKNDNVSVMDRQYSLNNYDNKYKKTENTSVEYYFENQDILNQLKGSGYRYLITTDANLSPISNIEDVNRLHIIAIKREQ